MPIKSGSPGTGSILARNLPARLRGKEIERAAHGIAEQTGLAHQPVPDGEHVSGVYRRSIMLASGRVAMLDDGMGFSLVPWKPVIEQRMGQQLSAVVRDDGVTWSFGRRRAMGL